MPSHITAARLQKRLLNWFDQHGRTQLPWQINKTPYRVWVSEIMLQQTQVATVIPYFEKFMHHYPGVASLAEAAEDEVLHLWAGLGYYSRARNLHHAAKKVVSEFNGTFPDSLEELVSLPGIGQSTAGAILSIAFQHPTPILDGNVKRVLARLHAITEPVNEKPIENRLWELAEYYTPKKRCADYTQAIMDLGATLCTRSKPACNTCPLNKDCLGLEQDIVASLPRKKAARGIPTRKAVFIIMRDKERILLQKRPPNGIWGGLWSLPEIEGEPNTRAIKTYCWQQYQMNIKKLKTLPSFRHTFSHYHLEIQPMLADIGQKTAQIMEDGKQIWYNPQEPAQIGLPKPIQTIMSRLK